MKRFNLLTGLVTILAIAPSLALAEELSPGDTGWMLTATALVLFMTLPGLSLFYAGLVSSRNVLSVLMQCFSIACLATVLWVIFGYSLAFSDGGAGNPWIGGLGNLFLAEVGRDAMSGTIPETVFAMFQLTFVIITPALVIGGFAERMRFPRHALVHDLVDNLGVSAGLPLGLGRRMARRDGCARFRGRTGRTPHGRSGSPDCSHYAWPEGRFPGTPDATAQPHPERDGCGHALGRLVRLQRRQCRRRQ